MFQKLKAKFKPTRSAHEEPEIIADMDALISEPSYFKLHDKVHKISPMLVGEFFRVSEALAGIHKLDEVDKITLSECIDKYYNIIHAVCPTITKMDIQNASQAQIAAVLQHVIEHITGVAHTSEKKKTLTRMLVNQENTKLVK